MPLTTGQLCLLCGVTVLLLARPTHAFGAGNIGSTSKIEGQNWRHGDLEDVLLTLAASKAMGGKKFGKLDVKRVYFGNWLRDYSQAVDVGTVKYVSAEAIRILLWVLGFMSFGYGTKEFEVTTERLGCYRPEEHIDNPKDYAENEDARQYDRRLRGPIDERRELAVDPQLGMKNYIASENLRIDTSAGLVRKLFGRSIELGRRYARSKNKDDLYEALRLLGTGCHCLEDFSAHSNYTELALIELGERAVFPHVGRNTKIRLQGARSSVYPLVTGTFGGVDFLHSVAGEFDDKVTQSEIQELEGTLEAAQNQGQNTSILQDLLHKIPDGVFGGTDEAGKADELKVNATEHQMQNTHISPREPEEWLQYLNDAQKQIYPVIEWHDEVMKSITETIENIPILPDLIEQLQEQVNVFVFSLLAPYVLPIINQVKEELNTGSSAIIQSSVDKQHIVFSDDDSSDPTHSMLSKDHFSNILNEPAGKVAGQVLRWVVPQLIACWDDEDLDVDRTLNRVIRGVLHHPALRDYGDDGAADGRRLMFAVVEKWWSERSEREKDGLRDQLSRDGVESGQNHKPGVVDHGHGSGKKLGMPNLYTAKSSGAPGNVGGFGDFGGGNNPSSSAADHVGRMAGEAVGGGALGAVVGGLATAIGGDLLGGGLGGDNSETYNRSEYGEDGSRTQTVTQIGSSGGRYGQAQYSRTEDSRGGHRDEYKRFEQTNEGGRYQSTVHREEQTSYGGLRSETRRFDENSSSSYGQREERPAYGGEETTSYGRRHNDNDGDPGYGRRRHGGEDEDTSYGRRGLAGGDEDNTYGRRHRGGDDDDQERTSYGRRNDDDEERSTHGRRREDESESYGRRTEGSSAYGRGYGQQQEPTEFGSAGGYPRRRDETQEMPGAFGEVEEPEGYGRQPHRRRGGDDEEEENEGRGYGGYRQEGSYGEGRRRGGGDGDRSYGGYGY